MRIHAFASPRSGSSHYRALEPMRELQRKRHEVVLHGEEQHLRAAAARPQATIGQCDVVYVSRYATADSCQLLRALNEARVPVVFDLDDDHISQPRRGGSAADRMRLAHVREMLRRADLVTTTSELLAAQVRREGAGCALTVPNYVTRAAAKTRRRKHQGVVLGWIAWADHQDDWDALRLERTLRRLLDAQPQLRIESVGPIDLRLPAPRYRRVGPVQFAQLPASIAGFDIGIAPLADVAHNRTRSDIKLKEYAIAGVPWAASALGPYAQLGEREGGRLVADDRWYEELEALVADASARRKLAKQGKRWARQQTLPRNIAAWEEALTQASALAAQRDGA